MCERRKRDPLRNNEQMYSKYNNAGATVGGGMAWSSRCMRKSASVDGTRRPPVVYGTKTALISDLPARPQSRKPA
jgi:hypothetical protein